MAIGKTNSLILAAVATLSVGSIPAPAFADDCMLGEIKMFAGNFAPRNYDFAHGQVLPISQNQSLFAIIGTIYGGDGRTAFALPDYRVQNAQDDTKTSNVNYIICLSGEFPSRN